MVMRTHLFSVIRLHFETDSAGKARRHPPTGWSSAKASSAYSRMLGDHAAFPSAGGVHGSPTGRDRFGQCNGRRVFKQLGKLSNGMHEGSFA